MISLVAGSRSIKNWSIVFHVLDSESHRIQGLTIRGVHLKGFRAIIHGSAQGVDKLAETWAGARDVPFLRVKARWDVEGKAAGMLRNERMVDLLEDQTTRMGIIIWDGESPGTEHTLRLLETRRIPHSLFIVQGRIMYAKCLAYHLQGKK